jgi:hypothetical protein
VACVFPWGSAERGQCREDEAEGVEGAGEACGRGCVMRACHLTVDGLPGDSVRGTGGEAAAAQPRGGERGEQRRGAGPSGYGDARPPGRTLIPLGLGRPDVVQLIGHLIQLGP